MCGSMFDVELFKRFTGVQVVSQNFAGVSHHAFAKWADVQGQVSSSLLASFLTTALPTKPIITTAKARNLPQLVKSQRGWAPCVCSAY